MIGSQPGTARAFILLFCVEIGPGGVTGVAQTVVYWQQNKLFGFNSREKTPSKR